MEDRGEFTIFRMELDELLKADPTMPTENEGAILDKRWREFVEGVELRQVATGRAAVDPHARLRSEHVEPAPRDADLDLSKAASHRKRSAIQAWLAGELALGKSLASLVAHAERFDRQAALLLRELGAELEAAA